MAKSPVPATAINGCANDRTNGERLYRASLAFNTALIAIAAARGLSLIILRAAAPTGRICEPKPGRFCDVDGGERIFGGTLHNLVTRGAFDRLPRLF